MVAGRRAGGFLRAGGQGTAKVVGGAPTVRRGEAAVRGVEAIRRDVEGAYIFFELAGADTQINQANMDAKKFNEPSENVCYNFK